MKFQLAINLERRTAGESMADIMRHTLAMVQQAERGGFHIVWSAEHHALEMNVAPNPFQILTWWSQHTEQIRLGTAVAVAAYWHPIRLASEAAFTDQLSGGRLEFGIGSGAYQREFDRMQPGLQQPDAYHYMHEMLPLLKKLWLGDCEHNGHYWRFPTATAVPKPVQQPHPPLWVAARSPITYDYAIENDCNIICWPIARDFAEAELYRQRLTDAMAKYPGRRRPVFALMRHTCVYTDDRTGDTALRAVQSNMGLFENLFNNLGDVTNGFPRQIPLPDLVEREQYDARRLATNLMFGNPEQVIQKLKQYEALGVDEFTYLASMGLDHDIQKKSLELFCREVIPAFR